MISLERVKEKLKWLSDVTGQNIKQTMADALWEEFQYADMRDFDHAIRDIGFTEERVNLANISKRIAKIRGDRIERETAEHSQREDDEIRLWFRTHSGSKQECINNFECNQCKRFYCDIVSKDCTAAIKRIIEKEITGEEAHRMLANKFHGIGFETHVPEMEPF